MYNIAVTMIERSISQGPFPYSFWAYPTIHEMKNSTKFGQIFLVDVARVVLDKLSLN